MERIEEKPPCDRCRMVHEDVGREPDCKSCMPSTLPENEDALLVYQLCRNQHVMSSAGPIDIFFPSVFGVMELYGVDDRRDCFEKVLKAYHHTLAIAKSKAANR